MKVTILQGPSGVGKTTYARKIADQNTLIVSADQWMVDDKGCYKFDPTKLGHCHAICLKEFVYWVQNCADTKFCDINHLIVDNTNTTVAEIAPYAALALAYGAELKVVTLRPAGSIDSIYGRNVHNVPRHTVQRQYDRIWTENAHFPSHWPKEVVYVD